jgi:hypothetical protein
LVFCFHSFPGLKLIVLALWLIILAFQEICQQFLHIKFHVERWPGSQAQQQGGRPWRPRSIQQLAMYANFLVYNYNLAIF